MFGFGRSRSEILAQKIEGLMVVVEAAVRGGYWNVAIYVSQQHAERLRELWEIGEWNEDRLARYLQKRGFTTPSAQQQYGAGLRKNLSTQL